MENERKIAIDGLVQLGLPLGEAKTYVTLLELGGSEATPLAKAARVPQPKIYAYLSNLERKGIVMKAEISGKPNVFTPVNYQLVIDQLREENEKKFTETEIVLNSIQQKQEDIEIREYISLIQGKKAVETGLKESIRKIKRNAIIINSPPHNLILDNLLIDRPEIDVKRPLSNIANNIENYPAFVQQLSVSPILDALRQNSFLIMFRDVDHDTNNCEAVVIVGYPHDLSNLRQEPLIIEITHSVITKFQLNLVLTLIRLLESLSTTGK